MEPTPAQRNRRAARMLLWILLAFFGVMVVANVMLVTLATQSWNGLWTEQPYEKGLAYNETLARRAQENALHWQVEATWQPPVVEVTLHDAMGAALQGAQVQAQVTRPTHEGFDQTVTLQEGEDGHYSAPLALPLPGQWDIRYVMTHPAGQLVVHQRIMQE